MDEVRSVAARLAVAVLVITLGGCAGTVAGASPTGRGDAGTGVAPAGRGSVDAPAWFTGRAPLPSCGQAAPGQGVEVPASAWDCLDGAHATGAELVVTQPTVEGDPIVTYYRVGPGIDGLEVMIDTTRDHFGPREWRHQMCPGTVSAADPVGCIDA